LLLPQSRAGESPAPTPSHLRICKKRIIKNKEPTTNRTKHQKQRTNRTQHQNKELTNNKENETSKAHQKQRTNNK
jgi:hypothetical protein